MTSKLKEETDLLLFAQMPPRLLYLILTGTYKNIYLGHQKCTINNSFNRDDKIVPKNSTQERGREIRYI